MSLLKYFRRKQGVPDPDGSLIIYLHPFARTDTYSNSFLPSTIKLWNSLPDSLVDLDDINQFKEDLSLHLFPTD